MSTIYIAEFSKENIKIGEKLKEKDPKTFCLLWENEDSKKSKEDYTSVLTNPSLKKFYMIKNQKENIYFLEAITNFIKLAVEYPDNIIVRGKLQEVWILYLIKSEAFINSDFHFIMDDLDFPIDDNYKSCLDYFDFIYSMSPKTKIIEYLFKTKNIFERFDSSKFKYIPEYMIHIPTVFEPLIFCNSKNIDEICNNKKIMANIINIDDANEEDLCIFGLISEQIVDASENEEFSLILNKIGKKGISLENFEKDNEYLYPEVDLNIENFAKFVVNKIEENLKVNEGKSIIGYEVS